MCTFRVIVILSSTFPSFFHTLNISEWTNSKQNVPLTNLEVGYAIMSHRDQYTFEVGQYVRYKGISDCEENPLPGILKVSEIELVQATCVDPLSSDYMGGQEGTDAVGHSQLLRVTGHENWISGLLFEPADPQMEVAEILVDPSDRSDTIAVNVYLNPHPDNQFFIDCHRILEVIKDVIDVSTVEADWLATTMQKAHSMYTTGGGGAIQLNEDLTVFVGITLFHIHSNPKTWMIDGSKIFGSLEHTIPFQKQYQDYGFFILVGADHINEENVRRVAELADKIAEALRTLQK